MRLSILSQAVTMIFLFALASGSMAQVSDRALSDRALIGVWKGPYKASCSEPGCAGELELTIQAGNPKMIAHAIIWAGTLKADQGEQQLGKDGQSWTVVYPQKVKILLTGDPTSGKLPFTLDPSVNPDRPTALPGTGVLTKQK